MRIKIWSKKDVHGWLFPFGIGIAFFIALVVELSKANWKMDWGTFLGILIMAVLFYFSRRMYKDMKEHPLDVVEYDCEKFKVTKK